MALHSEFEIPPDCAIFTTRKNGDRIILENVHLGADSAANLAKLVNMNNGDGTTGLTLTCTIKEKV